MAKFNYSASKPITVMAREARAMRIAREARIEEETRERAERAEAKAYGAAVRAFEAGWLVPMDPKLRAELMAIGWSSAWARKPGAPSRHPALTSR